MKRINFHFKLVFIFAAVLLLLSAAGIFFYRYQLIQYTADKIIRNVLPDNVRIGKMNFDIRNKRVVFNDFKILNPPGFSEKYLIEISEIECRYAMNGGSVAEGVVFTDPIFVKPVLYLERLSDGRINLREMQVKSFAREGGVAPSSGAITKDNSSFKKPFRIPGLDVKLFQGKTLPDLVKLPESFNISSGKFIFTDRMVGRDAHIVMLENINGLITLDLNDSYTQVISAGSSGSGNFNGRKNEVVEWDVKFNPNTPRLTMSNRFKASNINILAFEPYYNKFSPFTFYKGFFSGLLIFDFNNGGIGSTNEIKLSGLSFSIKPGMENSRFLETTVPDLVKYFQVSTGDIIFDFKIKGDMANPQFYLGPISKQALTSMAIDKISDIMAQVAGEQARPSGEGTPKKTDLEKAMEYVDMFKGIIQDKK